MNANNDPFELNWFCWIPYIEWVLSVFFVLSLLELLCLYFIPILFLFPDKNQFYLLFFLSLISTAVFFFFQHSIIYNSEKVICEAQLNPNQILDRAKDHHAIIIAISTDKHKKRGIFAGSDLLVMKFMKNSIPFHIYLCNTPSEANSVIYSQKTQYIYLFGHGKSGNLAFCYDNKREPYLLYYRSLINAPSKKFSSQLHCNSGNEKTLGEVLLEDMTPSNCYNLKGFVRGVNFVPDVWLSVRFVLIRKITDLYA